MLQRFLGALRTDLAIDLGTANTLVGVPGEGIVLDEPSVVAVAEKGHVLSGGSAVGHFARQMLGRTPESISVVRPLQNGVVADFALCEAMLKHFIRKARRKNLPLRPRVIVSVPLCATPVERRALFNSAQRAGAGEVYLAPQVHAAAVGVGLPVCEPLASMIVTIGGGTTEVAVLSLATIVASRSIRVGGDAMDAALVEYLARRQRLKIGLTAAEELRIEIGSAAPLSPELTAEVSGADATTGLPRKATVSSSDVREALAAPLAQIAFAVRSTLDDCGPDLAADLAERGLVLAGGGALLRGLHQFLLDQTGLPSHVAPDPLTATARGALICLEQFAKWRGMLESSHADV